MVDPHAHGCPEPEVLAAYVDRGLSLTERARVDVHLASCPQCIALLAGVARTVAEVSALVPDAVVTTEATPLITRRSLAGAMAAAAAVIAIVAAPSLVRPWLDRDTGLVNLVDSIGEQRSVLGRLTGGFPHAPLGVPSAGGQGGRAAGSGRVQLTAGKIRESFGERETPSQLHALGVAQLLDGNYDDAAQSLLAASREQPANAQYLSDVAAVQLERARLGLRPDDLPRALAAADRARRLNPSLKEAWFNRALAVSALSLRDEAKTAWTEYLKRDSASPWAGEARLRLAELEKPTPVAAWIAIEGRLQQTFDAATAEEAVRTQTTEARNLIENTLLVNWANAVINGVSGASELEQLRVMSQAMLRLTGDALYSDAVSAIDRADAAGSKSLRALAEAHRQYADAAALFAEDQHAAAAPRLAAARSALASSGSQYEWRAAIDFGAASYFIGASKTAAPLLEEVVAKSRQASYPFLSGRATWQQGLAAFQQGRLSEAQTRYEDTLATYEAMGDVEQRAAAHSLLAALHFYLGDKDEEWRHRQAALDGLRFSRSPRFKYAILASTAASLRFDAPESALLMQESVLATAREWGRNAAVADALAQRSSTLIGLGRNREAAEGIAEARAHLRSVSDPAFRRIFELPILAAESDLMRAEQPQKAADAAQQAIDIVQARGDRARLPQFELRLAKANIALGRLEEAERALAVGIGAFDEQRLKLTDEGALSAHDESWQLFETALRLAIRRGDHERAFAMAERARNRSVSEGRQVDQIPTLAQTQASLKPGDVIVALNQFEDELAVWAITHDAVRLVVRPLTQLQATRLVARQQLEIGQESATASSGAILFDEIIRPVMTQFSGAARLTVVPDLTFHDASFAALWNRSRKRFLVEDLIVTGAPSFLALASSHRPATDPRSDDVLVLSPQDDPTARAIAAVYQQPSVLLGSVATRSRLLEPGQQRGIIHLSARTQPNESFPFLAGVRLADDEGRRHSGVVFGRDIASRSFAQTRLVVLDEVEVGQGVRGEGTLSMARAFMAAGVPAVLGILPGANENATRDLMIGFHREMSKGVSAEQALSTVQRNAIQQNGGRLGAWSALVMYGSDR